MEQWSDFRNTLDQAIFKTGAITFRLILIEGPII
jgi:hypothetical protein